MLLCRIYTMSLCGESTPVPMFATQSFVRSSRVPAPRNENYRSPFQNSTHSFNAQRIGGHENHSPEEVPCSSMNWCIMCAQ